MAPNAKTQRYGTCNTMETLLVARDIAINTWSDWWGFKMEAYDGIQENLALVDRPKNGCAIVHSDSAEGIQRLNQEAAKAMMRGNRAGLVTRRFIFGMDFEWPPLLHLGGARRAMGHKGRAGFRFVE